MISCWNKATNVTLLFDGVFKLQCDESLSVLWVERPLQQGHDVHNSCIEKLSEEICHGLRLCFIIRLDSVLIGSLVQNVSFGDGRWLLGVATATQKHSSLRKGLVSESGLFGVKIGADWFIYCLFLCFVFNSLLNSFTGLVSETKARQRRCWVLFIFWSGPEQRIFITPSSPLQLFPQVFDLIVLLGQDFLHVAIGSSLLELLLQLLNTHDTTQKK